VQALVHYKDRTLIKMQQNSQAKKDWKINTILTPLKGKRTERILRHLLGN
jgi:hypothetical protein